MLLALHGERRETLAPIQFVHLLYISVPFVNLMESD